MTNDTQITFDDSELKMARYIVTGLTVVFLGFSACGAVAYDSDVRVAKAKAAAPGYTGCDNHCGTSTLEVTTK